MSCQDVEVRYNAKTYRWEVRRPGTELPAGTHPSKDQAVMLALELARDHPNSRILLYSDRDEVEAVFRIETFCATGRKETVPTRFLRGEADRSEGFDPGQQPSRKSDAANSRL
jgi:hypothetical protein